MRVTRSAHRADRHMGRMTQDSSMRMTMKAEVMMGMVGVGMILFTTGLLMYAATSLI